MNLEPLYALIRRFEGLRLKPYLDPIGIPTVGYGHTGPEVSMQSPPLTPAVADSLMRDDAEKHALATIKLSPELATDAKRLSAIADFVYNAGPSRYKASTLRRKVKAGEWLDARDELQRWVYAGGRKLPGLVVRRSAEADLL